MVSAVRNAICWAILGVAALGATPLSGQQPKRKPEPYVAPILPAEQAWLVTLPAAPSAGGAMDDAHIYVPLQDLAATVEGAAVAQPGTASITALHRETGLVSWTRPIASAVAPLVQNGTLYVAAADRIQALDPRTGETLWQVPLGKIVRGPLRLRGMLLLALTEPDELVAIRVDTRDVAWRRTVGETAAMSMAASDRAVYLTSASRIFSLNLADGSPGWERTLEGTLGEPAAAGDRVLVGSTTDSLWALDPESGKDKWVWRRRVFGGDVIGAVIEGDTAYVTSADNIVRALDRGNGHQLWKAEVATRPVLAPRAFFGAVAVVGFAPTVLSTFDAKEGTAISTWEVPGDAVLLGPPLIDEQLKPYRVAMAIVMRDGRVMAARPTAMKFPEPAAVPLTVVPGRVMPREPAP